MRTSITTILTASALALAGCGGGSTTDGGVTDSGPQDGGGTDGGGTDGGGGGGDCAMYCTEVMTNCTGPNAQYVDMADCMAYCAEAMWPAGTAGAMSGNTLACRIYHGGVPASAAPATHCPHAGPTGATVCGTVNFRTTPEAMYTRVDRMGMPAVSTALVPSANKNAYNDADPTMDAALTFAPAMLGTLHTLHTALDAQLMAAPLSLTPCTSTASGGALPECVAQNVAPSVTVASLVIPDTLQVNPGAAQGFPNGRKLTDPVIDVTLAVIFLRMGAVCGSGTCSPTTFASIPLNPPMNDSTFLTTFPYLAAAH